MESLAEATILCFPKIRVSMVDAFLRGLNSEATKVAYRQVIQSFQNFLPNNDMKEVTRLDVEAYRGHIEALGRSSSTVAKHISAISAYFKFLVQEGITDLNPAASARRPKVPSTSPRKPLSVNEVQAMMDACRVDTMVGLRDRAMLLCLAIQGWRIAEVLALSVQDLGEEAGHKVATIQGKGNKVLRVPLAATTWAAISTWRSHAEITTGPIFARMSRTGKPRLNRVISQQAAWKRLRLLAKRAGIKRKVHAHLFRHYCITEALAAGVPLHLVQAFARHSDPATTQRYNAHRELMHPLIFSMVDIGLHEHLSPPQSTPKSSENTACSATTWS